MRCPKCHSENNDNIASDRPGGCALCFSKTELKERFLVETRAATALSRPVNLLQLKRKADIPVAKQRGCSSIKSAGNQHAPPGHRV